MEFAILYLDTLEVVKMHTKEERQKAKLQTIFRPQVELRWQTRPGRKGTKAHSCWHVQSTFYSDIQ